MKKLIIIISLVMASLAAAVTIQEINGPSANGNYYVSPYKDLPVTDVEGIVTAKKFYKSGTSIKVGGFYMQSETPDNDPRTSEGILVYLTPSFTGSVAIGQKVKVGGILKEYGFTPPDGNALELTVREISGTSTNPLTVDFISANNPVVPVKIGTKADTSNPNKRLIPTERIFDTDLAQTANENQINLFDITTNPFPKTFDPASNALDFWRSMQGMLVEIDNPLFCSPTFYTAGGTKKTTNFLVADNGEGATVMNARGGITIRLQDRNGEIIAIEPGMFPGWSNNQNTLVDVQTGDKINGSFKAIVDYNYGAYKLYYTDSTEVSEDKIIRANLPKEVTTLTGNEDHLTVSSFNVENLNPTDDQIKFTKLALGIIENLKNPDIIGIEEIQDNSGTANDGTVDANETFTKLLQAVSAQGGPTYDYRQINPVNGADGGQGGGNIRVGFLFNPARVQFVDRAAPSETNISTTAVLVNDVNGKPQLSWSPGRVSPEVAGNDTAWVATRKPLVGEFVFNNQTIFVIANHFSSKGGDKQKFMGRYQSPYLASELKRMMQADKVANFMKSILAVNPEANVIALGDWNDFQFSNPLRRLTGEDTNSRFMHSLDELLPEEERYAYYYAGNAQALDHILVSNSIWTRQPEFDVVHINAEYNSDNRLSDHDPEVAKLRFTGVGIDDNYSNKSITMMSSYPNPFNPSTTINFALAQKANVELGIYNIAGEKVASLVNGVINKGANSIVWNASKFNSGVYFAKLSVDNKMVQTSKLMLVK